MYRYYIYIVVFLLVCAQNLPAQIKVYTESYSSKNGLAQNDVNDMVRDSCGFYWLATDDGLSRFDGYSFVNYKISTNQFHCSLNNQFEQIHVDASNNIWARNSMGQALLFNQSSHQMELYPNPQVNRGADYTYIRDIKILGSDVWLIGSENGAIRVSKTKDEYVVSRYCYADSSLGTLVNSIGLDNEANTWLLTTTGLGFIPKGSKKITQQYFVNEGFAFVDFKDLGNDLFFICDSGRVVRYDKLKKRFSLNHLSEVANLKHIYPLTSEAVIIAHTSGLLFYNVLAGVVERTFALPSADLSWQDEYSNIWVVDKANSVYKYSVSTNTFAYCGFKLPVSLKNKGFTPNKIAFAWKNKTNDILWPLSQQTEFKSQASNDLCRVLSTNDGVYWTKNNTVGIQKNISVNSTFQFIKLAIDADGGNSIVTAVCEDHLGRLLIATSDHKLRVFRNDLCFIGYLNAKGQISAQPACFGKVNTLYIDRGNNLWIAGDMAFYKLTHAGANAYSLRTFQLDKKTPQGTEIKDILEDKFGHIWLATDGDGLQLLNYTNSDYKLVNRRNELKNSYPPTLLKTNCLYEDDNGNIWLGSNEGITIFSSDIPQLRFLKFFFYNPENSNMTTSVVSGLFQDKDGKMWISSYGGGLLKTTNKLELGEAPEFISFNRENNKLSSDLVLSTDEDANGNMWLVTEKSIIKFDKNIGQIESYGIADELSHEGLGRQIFTRLRNGAFVLGSNSGFYYITPETIQNNKHSTPLVFTRFLLFNREVGINAENSPLTADINLEEEVVLKHKQNVFSIEFAALDFQNTQGIEYAYKLENFEENWNYVGAQRLATYTNLPPGEYLFRVKSTNGEGNWCDNDKTVRIVVQPSFWQTAWAWILYLLIAGCLIGGALYAYLTIYKMRSKMQLEQDINAMKMQFFTDISHELRTPLTLIDAPLENVLQNNNLNAGDREQLEIVKNNTKRMLRMLTQILDFRKLQSNKMRLKVEKTHIFNLIDKCCSNFQKMADKRSISFLVLNNITNDLYWVDRDKMDTVMFNLLSNAFKFTQEGKKITVSVENKDEECLIRVSDQGCGMPKDKLNTIFERFNTLSHKSLTNQTGTGIGLALVKEILDLHKADIKVESSEGEGSEFTIHLKPGTAHFDELMVDININDNELPKNNTTNCTDDVQAGNEGLLKLLVVEDNDDLRHFVVSVLSKTYKVIEAANGQEGYEKTVAEMPDFVLSDIMMPIMDGVEMVRKVRENVHSSHIPVVLLTAKTDLQSKVDCLKIGANDYITKPFSMVYLQARIDNIITERRLLQEKYRIALQNRKTDNIDNAEPAQREVEQFDKRDNEFMNRVVDYINGHLDDPDLSPDSLANGLKVSRWNLTCKMKSLVGQPPVEFIKDVRLNKAAQLIRQGEMNMTQISYMIGMTDSRYFSRVFKQKFGMTPTEFKNKKD